MKTPKNTFEKVMMYPKALDELKIHELEIAKDEGIEWLKEIDRLLNDAIDTVDRNYQRLGQIDELGLPTGSGYAKEIQSYSDWHKKAKKQAESVLSEIDKKLINELEQSIPKDAEMNITHFVDTRVKKSNRQFATKLLTELELLRDNNNLINYNGGKINISGTIDHLLNHKVNEDPPTTKRSITDWVNGYIGDMWDF